MKSNRLFGSVLILCILFLTFEPCHAQQYSPEFQALLNQIQQYYLAPKGENISFLRSQFPAVMAALIGHALRQQTVHVQQNPSLNNRFMNLQQEARAYITDVARTTSFIPENGRRFTPEDLWNIVNKVLQGQDDAWILQNFNVRTGTMPSVMVASPGPQPPGPPLGKLPTEEKNQIELLGKTARPKPENWKTYDDKCKILAFYYSDECTGYRQQKEAEAEAARQKSRALNPDGITMGSWRAWREKGNLQLKIWKQGDTYLGSVSGDNLLGYNFKHNEVCLRIKYAGAGKDGPVYKGKIYVTSGIQADYSWQDVNYYYYLSGGKEVLSEGPSGSPRDFRR